MKRFRVVWIVPVLLMLTVLQRPAWSEPPRASWFEDVDAAARAAKTSGRPIVIVVTARNCRYCVQMERDTFDNDDIVSDLQQSFVAVRVDGSAHPRLARKLGVRAFPTTIITDSDARVVETLSGYVGPEQFRKHLQAAAAR